MHPPSDQRVAGLRPAGMPSDCESLRHHVALTSTSHCMYWIHFLILFFYYFKYLFYFFGFLIKFFLWKKLTWILGTCQQQKQTVYMKSKLCNETSSIPLIHIYVIIARKCRLKKNPILCVHVKPPHGPPAPHHIHAPYQTNPISHTSINASSQFVWPEKYLHSINLNYNRSFRKLPEIYPSEINVHANIDFWYLKKIE